MRYCHFLTVVGFPLTGVAEVAHSNPTISNWEDGRGYEWVEGLNLSSPIHASVENLSGTISWIQLLKQSEIESFDIR